MSEAALMISSGERAPTKAEILRSLCRRIRYQFPRTPEGALMSGIVERAVLDLGESGAEPGCDGMDVREHALRYLASDMPHAQIAGVDPAWIRKVIASADATYDIL